MPIFQQKKLNPKFVSDKKEATLQTSLTRIISPCGRISFFGHFFVAMEKKNVARFLLSNGWRRWDFWMFRFGSKSLVQLLRLDFFVCNARCISSQQKNAANNHQTPFFTILVAIFFFYVSFIFVRFLCKQNTNYELVYFPSKAHATWVDEKKTRN